jgi:bifunctional enzyme CysN/CysC
MRDSVQIETVHVAADHRGEGHALHPPFRIAIVGHVGHGKSTLIGRLLYETNSLPDGKAEQLKTVSMGSRDFVLIEVSGHAEFLRNTITGAAHVDAAILVIDATEGIRDQTRQHGYLLHLLGIRQMVVAINKMDRIAYDATRFREIETEITEYLTPLGLSPTEIIPVSAREGVGITEHTYTSEWYRPTVIEALDKLSPVRAKPELPLHFYSARISSAGRGAA